MARSRAMIEPISGEDGVHPGQRWRTSRAGASEACGRNILENKSGISLLPIFIIYIFAQINILNMQSCACLPRNIRMMFSCF